MALATGIATVALDPVATAAPNPVAAADVNPSMPTVTVHATTAPMTIMTPHAGVTQTAGCPTGTLVGGGGYLRNATDPSTLPTNGLVLGGTNPSTGTPPVDQPLGDTATNPNHWMAFANFTGVAEAGDQATAFALCASNGPTHTVVASTSTVGANALQQVSPPNVTIATCPTGTTLIGGGAFTTTPDQVNDGTTVGYNGNLKPLGSYPSDSSGVPAADGSTSATSWSAYGSAGITSANDKVTAIALCTSDPIGPVQIARVDFSGPDAQPATTITTATAVCPAGTQMFGGGFRTDETVNGTSGLQPQQGYHMRGSYPSTDSATPPTDVADATTNPSAWSTLLQAGGQNLPAGSSVQLHTFALCAQPTTMPTPTQTPSPIQTPSPTPATTPTPTPIATPTTPTPSPSPTPRSTPTATPTPIPAPGATATTTTLTVIRVPLPFALGGLVIPIANVTPRNADGTVQFTDAGHNLGPAATVHGGVAIGLIAVLGKRSHSITAQFTPTDPAAFQSSTSKTVMFRF
jgi:outer membrane biosynthesis protein TonB